MTTPQIAAETKVLMCFITILCFITTPIFLLNVSIKTSRQMSTRNLLLFCAQNLPAKRPCQRRFRRVCAQRCPSRSGNAVPAPFKQQGPFQPRPGGGVISGLNVMPADICRSVIAIGVERVGAVEIRPCLIVPFQPVKTHAINANNCSRYGGSSFMPRAYHWIAVFARSS